MLKTILGYTLGIIGSIIITPFVLSYYVVLLFWKIFGTSILGFFVVALFGGTEEECFRYGASLGFFIGIYLKYRELSK